MQYIPVYTICLSRSYLIGQYFWSTIQRIYINKLTVPSFPPPTFLSIYNLTFIRPLMRLNGASWLGQKAWKSGFHPREIIKISQPFACHTSLDQYLLQDWFLTFPFLQRKMFSLLFECFSGRSTSSWVCARNSLRSCFYIIYYILSED